MRVKIRSALRIGGLAAVGLAVLVALGWAAFLGDPTLKGSIGGSTTVIVDPSTSTTGASDTSAPDVPGTTGGVSAIPLTVTEARGMAIAASGDILFQRPGHSVYAWDAMDLTRELVKLTAEDNSITITTGVVDGGPDLPDPYRRELNTYQAHGAQAMATGAGVYASRDGRPVFVIELPIGPDPVLVELGLPYQTSRTVTLDMETWAVVEVTTTMSNGETIADDLDSGVMIKTISRDALHPAAAVAGGQGPTRFEGGFSLVPSFSGLGVEVYDPSWIPEGFVLSLRAFAAQPLSLLEGTSEVAVLAYRNQTACITITFRPALGAQASADPWNQRGDAVIEGTYAFETAGGEFTIAPPSGTLLPTHAWGVIGGTLVTIDGALSTADAERIIEGLGA